MQYCIQDSIVNIVNKYTSIVNIQDKILRL